MKAHKVLKRERRHKKIRKSIAGLLGRPRLSLYKSNTRVYGQIIDDTKGTTLVAIRSGKSAKSIGKNGGFGKTENARAAGKELAEKAVAKKIKKVVFDRGGFAYTGRVRAFAEGAREGGLIF